MPIYSFVRHQREKETTSVYSPHVLILEGILALHDPRILELLDMKVSKPPLTVLCQSHESRENYSFRSSEGPRLTTGHETSNH